MRLIFATAQHNKPGQLICTRQPVARKRQRPFSLSDQTILPEKSAREFCQNRKRRKRGVKRCGTGDRGEMSGLCWRIPALRHALQFRTSAHSSTTAVRVNPISVNKGCQAKRNVFDYRANLHRNLHGFQHTDFNLLTSTCQTAKKGRESAGDSHAPVCSNTTYADPAVESTADSAGCLCA